jgi:tetratricopeptide (TPR) repeat protein
MPSILARPGEPWEFRVHLICGQEGAMMSGLRRSSGLCFLLVFPMVVCVQATFAETNNPTPSAPDVATPHRAAAMSPEDQGDMLLNRRRYEAAIQAYQRETNPSAKLWNKIGIAYHHMFAFEQARKCYQRALAINPHYAEALNNLGAVYYSRRDFAQAERAYQLSLKYQANDAIVLKNMGMAYLADDKYKLGMEAYQKAIAEDPNVLHPDPLSSVEEGATQRQAVANNYYLARICAAAGKTKEAIEYLQKALDEGFHNRKQLMKDK